MGDASAAGQPPAPKETPNEPEVTRCDEPKTSIDVLRESRPSENIAVLDPDAKVSSTVHTVFKTDLEPRESPLHGPRSSTSSHERDSKASNLSVDGDKLAACDSKADGDETPQRSPTSGTEAGRQEQPQVEKSEQKREEKEKQESQQSAQEEQERQGATPKAPPAKAREEAGAGGGSLEKKRANTDITDASDTPTPLPTSGPRHDDRDKSQASCFSMPTAGSRERPITASSLGSTSAASSSSASADSGGPTVAAAGARPECISTTIFSVSGAPSRKLYRKREVPTTIFPAGCMGCKEEPPSDKVTQKSSADGGSDKTAAAAAAAAGGAAPGGLCTAAPVSLTPQSSSSTSLNRNPLTGTGVHSKDEYRMKNNVRRVGGNPVLGLGYDEPTISPSSTRIPPGGHSNGLW